jgi:hypothetical protein
MKYSKHPPPIYEKARKLWGVDFEKGVVFTYGDTCHTATGTLPNHMVPHEETHSLQQGDDPAAWWEEYMRNPAFRLAQELEAYRAQYAWIRLHVKGRQQQFELLKKLARDLSGPMYGLDIGFQKALMMIANYNGTALGSNDMHTKESKRRATGVL